MERRRVLVKIGREALQVLGFAIGIAGAALFVSPDHYAVVLNNSTYSHFTNWVPGQVFLLGALLGGLGFLLIVKAPEKPKEKKR
jgi:hypothetical protein